ncbi:trifunctional transcriptional regulator/proline dehydrogenase/L-glutamate gamma-semialdehyde dehydrogenase [Croceicoccus sp. YJ47]|uniref:trifunctional transcriptional regulator/proline dehydrogenase/L-glutamate gamma-semialdehyde dehydrogenase n=1 Tax=Croceicoccus sp. YJ47 TaxID=2798724 RepID=UPI001F007EB6|nr:trifunctional transcriptional regulator/proline dehydrogenase/L-glutamate gamma-semialdehyde dehydrogenase [Croceicoccus sp. YJ47]
MTYMHTPESIDRLNHDAHDAMRDTDAPAANRTDKPADEAQSGQASGQAPDHAVIAGEKAFTHFAPPVREQSELRRRITDHYRCAEPDCLQPLLEYARRPKVQRQAAQDTAYDLVMGLRKARKPSGVEGLVQEFSLSTQEGVALMCLAEALLRVPDAATRDALIRDKISGGNWRSHVGEEKALFINAASWGLMFTGHLTGSVGPKGMTEKGLANALTRVVARVGEPVIRKSVDIAMRMMGEQFVTGEDIDEALKRARHMEKKGFSYSFDMLGEAAATMKGAEGYFRDYETAIHAIGKAANGRGIYEGAGISIKLSALHPRYERAQADRVMDEMLPKVIELARLAKHYDIGLNIDAEEADRLELSLDILESLAVHPDLAGWNGLGFVVQAFGKRAFYVLDWIVDLAKRSDRRIMIRLVKGAYWDAEIKQSQVEGLDDFPVFTRKLHTDVSFLACAKKLLEHKDVVFPQFATHNAQSLAAIYHMAGPDDFEFGDYEFQCLHGMGEPLYEQVVGADKLNRPCRIYAPVGTHETLLAYLVRRLLENGANSSFVNRISDPAVPASELVVDPVKIVRDMPMPGRLHDRISLPKDIYGERRNSDGMDISDERDLAAMTDAMIASAKRTWTAFADGDTSDPVEVLNPADHRDVVGHMRVASPEVATAAMARAAASKWNEVPLSHRADMLERAADAMQERMPELLGLLVREAGKSVLNGIAEVREAIDFLRYYAMQAREIFDEGQKPLGPVVCISPWNFPMAIFTGQVAAALIGGNTVVAKPAEETPLIAAEAVRMLHEAGIPRDALQLMPGFGETGAALIGSPEVAGVMFTGSTEVARIIQKQLADRLSPEGKPIPLIAETGGQNAMIVDSTALPEQVVGDVIGSAFDSAGQRCSALRVLCLQDSIADNTLDMLKGALQELRIGSTDRLSNDIGPVISAEAKDGIEKHIAEMEAKGCRVHRLSMPDDTAHGTFVAPTIIEIDNMAMLTREVFGPVLHVVRFKAHQLDAMIDAINDTGYGLTFGLHTRMDERVAHVVKRIKVGNVYVNRNQIGAIVGVQPFGARGLSGTGPKAGGPLYLRRLVKNPPVMEHPFAVRGDTALLDYGKWLHENGEQGTARRAKTYGWQSALGVELELPGPVGEQNLYALHSRGRILCLPETRRGMLGQLAAVIAAGGVAVFDSEVELPADLPQSVQRHVSQDLGLGFAGALIEGDADRVKELQREIAKMDGPILLTQAATPRECLEGGAWHVDWMLEEVSTSIDTTAAGGNASLMMLG